MAQPPPLGRFGQLWRLGRVARHFACVIAVSGLGVSSVAAPPPDANGAFREWFGSLTVPGAPQTSCCTIADCRMVESRWNPQTQHYEARVIRDVFSNALRNLPLFQNDQEAFEAARGIWMRTWIASFGEIAEIWVVIPESRVNPVPNPTGKAVLCWNVFSGVFCFMPFQAASNDYGDRVPVYV